MRPKLSQSGVGEAEVRPKLPQSANRNEPAHEIMVLIRKATSEGSGAQSRQFAHMKYGSR